ncbi:hypothetical protein HGRIS_004874 [Hohenbuehelia grisea]|uniref:Protein Zds1 C-terminal domain-containing protein n=1 Tax=Hohenbuehelia grisea TaxID=104357 RepID=A0ABR3JDP9_9AGAR
MSAASSPVGTQELKQPFSLAADHIVLTMQPSTYDIQREVEALRDIRRRSTTPGALTIDPDLPNQSPPGSPTNTYWSPTTSNGTPSFIPDDSSSSSHSSGSDPNSGASSSIHNGVTATNNPADDPFHLFWVPASLHPEIAPAEFRAFLKEHARAPVDGPGGSLDRAASISSNSSGLSRKRSMLSRQYKPSENDNIEEEDRIVPLSRNRSSAAFANRGPQLTISDLQKLEELAEEASQSDDPSKLRHILRRSLSLNISPSAIDQMDDMPEMGDEADAPIIVPPPGQILRRAARTKIRKPGLPGDGGGHRFGSTRRGATRSQSASTSVPMGGPRSSASDVSSSDHGEYVAEPSAISSRSRTFSNENIPRPESYSEETSIYDSYAREDDDVPVAISPPPSTIELPALEVQPSLSDALSPVQLYHPQPERLIGSQPLPDVSSQQPSRTPSPPSPSDHSPPQSTENFLSPVSPSGTPPQSFLSASPSPTRKDKEKKGGLFGKWGSDKAGKKGGKDKDREKSEKEKDSGFFGSLFGSKKKQDEHPSTPIGSGSGRETAQALLGQSKSSRGYTPSTSPNPQLGSPNMYARYPIHVERAIYRLSHIKLANPRRPLYEQVLISNLMFWYLGVINKAQAGNAGQPAPATAQGPADGESGNAAAEKEQLEREQREREEKERLEREQREREQKEREMEMKKRETPRRGPLTKPASGQAGPGGRRAAEMPVRGPQYEMQHRVMEQEYGGYGDGERRRPTSAGRGDHRMPHQAPPKMVQPQQDVGQFYYNVDDMSQKGQAQQSRLPPGAMAPASNQQLRKPSSSSPPPQRRSRSPPPSNNYGQPSLGMYANGGHDPAMLGGGGGAKLPGRSLSATAVPSSSPHMNGKAPSRKGSSVHAVSPTSPHGRQESDGMGEEEDMPLAVWQQQRRR